MPENSKKKFKVIGVMQFEAIVEVEAENEKEALRIGRERLDNRDYDYRDREILCPAGVCAYEPEG